MGQVDRLVRYNGLQVLRVMAALFVVLSHFSGNVAAVLGPAHRIWFSGGKAGVDIFFVISGFVMLYSSADLLSRPRGWLIFAKRRIIRVVPLYWLATGLLLLAIIVFPRLFRDATHDVHQVVSSLLFWPVRNNRGDFYPLLSVGWTLNFEMFFYTVFCFSLLFRRDPSVCVSAFMMGCVLLSLWKTPLPSVLAFYCDPIVLDFVAGMGIAALLSRGIRLPLWAAAVTAVVSLTFLCVTISANPWEQLLKSGLPAMALVYATASLEQFFTNLPPICLMLAEASYAMYLFHIFVLDAARSRLASLARVPSPWLYLAVTVVVTVLSLLIRRYMEAPLLRRLNRLWSTGASDTVRSGDLVMKSS